MHEVVGRVEIELRDKHGNLKYRSEGKNLVTNTGKALLASLLTGVGGVTLYLALGTSNTAANAADTALGAESTTLGAARKLAETVTRITTSVTNDTLKASAVFLFTGVLSLKESGLFASAEMVAHRIFGTVTTANGDVMTVNWTIQF